jgi:hypothetical protein
MTMLVALCANDASDVAIAVSGLVVPARSALICTSASVAATMMTAISANSLRSSR